MRTLAGFIFFILAGLAGSAQNYGPIPTNIKKITDYFGHHTREKIIVATDKTKYKPGETIWFRAMVTDGDNQVISNHTPELFVKLYDSKGKPDFQQLFKLVKGKAQGDLILPQELSRGIRFLCVYTSAAATPEEISITVLTIDPGYPDQRIADITLKDSISVAGQKNEATIVLRELSGETCKNTNVLYQIKNGIEIIEKGKLKTDRAGGLTIPFTLPAKTNGEPFILELSDNRDEWKSEKILPSNLDTVLISFYPEGGTLLPGTRSKIGFTAFNKWGIPVDIEGVIQDQDSKTIAQVNTITRGLGLFSAEIAAGQKYKLVISGKTAQRPMYDLPVPDQKGVTLSLLKNDAGFILANLIMTDKQKQSITLTINQGSKMYWAAEMEMEKSGPVKIPADNLPHGINQLTAFSEEGEILAERILFIDKKQDIKITVNPEKSSLVSGETMKIKVHLADENNQPLTGNITVAVTDQFRRSDGRPLTDEYMLPVSELETPYSLIGEEDKGKITYTRLMDIFLIANRFKSLKRSDTKQNETEEINFDLRVSDYLKGYGKKYDLRYNFKIPDPGYFASNKEQFQKAPKVSKTNTIALENQRRMLESASSILDVIKTIKPYSIKNNMIVFVGSENSLNYQGGALIVLDRQQMGTDISALSGISPLDVDHINVSTNAMDIQRYTGLNSVGIIEVFLKRGTSPVENPTMEPVEKYENGFRIPGKFSDASVDPGRNNRTTLLWIPEQPVDQTGNFEFLVTAGKVLSEFVIEVQAISSNGRIGSGKTTFSVTR